ncbi:MAG: hypothetical protein COB36_04785 [Alphaproteobacteria bacterium]|nr:MAG: hypothetical protein COB36_04785 [Alphaproteobacteria bacterium]
MQYVNTNGVYKILRVNIIKNIIISEQTQESIDAIAPHMEQWIPRGMTTLFISPEDAANPEILNALYAQLPQDIQDKRSIDDLGERAGKGTAGAATYDLDNDGQNDFGIIYTRSVSDTKFDILSEYVSPIVADSHHRSRTYAPDVDLLYGGIDNTPGADGEWRAIVIAHEIGHLDQIYNPLLRSRENTLVREMEADQNAHDWFSEINPAVADAKIQFRAINSFYRIAGMEHSTSAGVSIDGEELPRLDSPTQEEFLDIRDRFIEDAERIFSDADNMHITANDLDVLRAINSSSDLSTLNESLSPSGMRLWDAYSAGQNFSQAIHGIQEAKDIVYETLGLQAYECVDADSNYLIPPSVKQGFITNFLGTVSSGGSKGQRALEGFEEEDVTVLRQISEGIMSPSEGESLLTESALENVGEMYQKNLRLEGRGIAFASPALYYQATRESYTNGSFDHDPVVKQYAAKFLNACETLFPEDFQTGGNETNTSFPTQEVSSNIPQLQQQIVTNISL